VLELPGGDLAVQVRASPDVAVQTGVSCEADGCDGVGDVLMSLLERSGGGASGPLEVSRARRQSGTRVQQNTTLSSLIL
jgi:hypothetical protein